MSRCSNLETRFNVAIRPRNKIDSRLVNKKMIIFDFFFSELTNTLFAEQSRANEFKHQALNVICYSLANTSLNKNVKYSVGLRSGVFTTHSPLDPAKKLIVLS